eukprot:scaffold83211_cov63-Phaeocystis_antarctica.AAC.1
MAPQPEQWEQPSMESSPASAHTCRFWGWKAKHRPIRYKRDGHAQTPPGSGGEGEQGALPSAQPRRTPCARPRRCGPSALAPPPSHSTALPHPPTPRSAPAAALAPLTLARGRLVDAEEVAGCWSRPWRPSLRWAFPPTVSGRPPTRRNGPAAPAVHRAAARQV